MIDLQTHAEGTVLPIRAQPGAPEQFIAVVTGCRPQHAGHGWRVEIDELPGLQVYATRSRRPCEIDITVEHHPGVMGVTYSSDIQNKARRLYASGMVEMAAASGMREAAGDQVVEVGAQWAAKQVEELFDRGAPSVHFYVMQSARAVGRVLELLGRRPGSG